MCRSEGTKKQFFGIKDYGDMYSRCVRTGMLGDVGASEYMVDANFRKDIVGCYSFVDRDSGEMKNGIVNLYNIELPDRDLSQFRVAANYENVFYVKMVIDEPVVELFGENRDLLYFD